MSNKRFVDWGGREAAGRPEDQPHEAVGAAQPLDSDPEGVRRVASGKKSNACVRCGHPVALGHTCPYLIDEAWETRAENASAEAFLAAGRGRRSM